MKIISVEGAGVLRVGCAVASDFSGLIYLITVIR